MKEASDTIECHVEEILMNISDSGLKGAVRYVEELECRHQNYNLSVVVDSGEEC